MRHERSEPHIFKVMPRRRVVERGFAWFSPIGISTHQTSIASLARPGGTLLPH